MDTPAFLVYLALIGGHSVYRIESDSAFSEVQVVGTRLNAHRIVAHTRRERLRIADMLSNTDGRWRPLPAAEFEVRLERAQGG